MSSAEASLWPTAYMSEQHRLCQDCADAQAQASPCCSHCKCSFPMRQLIFSCSPCCFLQICLKQIYFIHGPS